MLSTTKSGMRVRNQVLVRAILSNRATFGAFMLAAGGRSLKKYRYPRRRAELVFRVFFRDIEKSAGLLTGADLQRLIERLNSDDREVFGKGAYRHFREYLSQDRSMRRYYFDLMRHFLRDEAHRESLPKDQQITSLTIDLTQRCNSKCTHCFADSTPSKRDSIDLEATMRFMQEAVDDGGCRFFAILGGEPLLEVDRLRTMARRFPYKPFVVFTNGSLVTDKTLAKLKDCPNVSIFVSIEGFKDLTDRIRGSRAFERADRALAALRRNNMVFGVSLTATKENFREIVSNEFVNYVENSGSFMAWVFELKPIGRAANRETRQLILEGPDKEVFNAAVTKLNQTRKFIYINTEKDPGVIGGCPAHKGTYMHVGCDGHVTPCIAQRYFASHVSVLNMSYLDVIGSDFIRAFRAIGNGEGCPTRFYPAETKVWIQEHELGYLYGDPVSAGVERAFLDRGNGTSSDAGSHSH